VSPELTHCAPILPVRDVRAALEHYAALGFTTRVWTDGEGYGFADRDGVALHLGLHLEHHHDEGEEHDHVHPPFAPVSIYIYVDDPDGLVEEWSRPGLGGETHPAEDTPWQMREGVQIDPDGNAIRFGRSLSE